MKELFEAFNNTARNHDQYLKNNIANTYLSKKQNKTSPDLTRFYKLLELRNQICHPLLNCVCIPKYTKNERLDSCVILKGFENSF